jgi:hypothetical protein
MFMRYRGGGVGHTYMRAIEVWLAETGWGSDDTPILGSDSDTGTSEDEDPGDNGNSGDDGADENTGPDPQRHDKGESEEEASEEEASEKGDTSDSSIESDQDPDHSDLYATDEENEETMDGEYGFSSL